jgi:predicted amidophosphoribosyltransferase
LKTAFILLTLVGMAIVAGPAFTAQQKKPPKPAPKAAIPKVLYGCSHCRLARTKAGKCPVCGQGLTKLKAYICPQCLAQSDQAGQCARDKSALQPTAQFLAANAQVCPKCHTVIGKNVNCPVCAKAAGHH